MADKLSDRLVKHPNFRRAEGRGTGLIIGAQMLPRWRVDYRGKRAQHLGTVAAPDARSAIAKAATLFHIAPALRNKLVVTQISGQRQSLSESSSPLTTSG